MLFRRLLENNFFRIASVDIFRFNTGLSDPFRVKIGILSFRQAGKRAAVEELRLLQAAKALGHQAFIFRSESCQLFYDEKNKSWNRQNESKK